jgi:signal transduction histidine kinase
MVVPLTLRGQAYGALVALDRRAGDPGFTRHDQRLLEWFAASAATGLVTALVVSTERERARLAAAKQERGQWARELHEGTLQRLAGLRLELIGARGAGNLGSLDKAVATAIDDHRSEIMILRSLSFELRPSLLDELGLESAIVALADLAEQSGVAVDFNVDLAYERGRHTVCHSAEFETAIYRIVQERLSNVQEHASATHAKVTVTETENKVELIIEDDGVGFEPADVGEGFGFAGLRDRVDLLDGALRIDSSPGHGTTVQVELPVRRGGPRARPAHPTPARPGSDDG